MGNVCSDCHAGENPLIIHGAPLQNLQGNLPSAWYDPIVRTGDTVPWPENPGPMNSPPSCSGCHGTWNARSFAGRLPHLASNLGRYCTTVMRPSLGALPWNLAGGTRPPSMPVGNAGGLACTPTKPGGDPRCNATMTASCTINAATGGVDAGANPAASNYIQCTPELAALLNWCGQAPAANGSTRGDPHVRNVNGVPYDFQAAGEFVYLRSGLGTEVQVRQSPVSTQQPIGPDSHTGLISCVSINTAMAARVGSTRVTLQSAMNGEVNPKMMELRIDGKSVALSKRPVKLDGGGRITRSALGTGVEIDFPDKTHLTAIPNFWAAPHNVWYLDVEISNTPGRDGIMGAIPIGSWLPALADGSMFGSRPASLSQRYVDFNRRFADSWRVPSTDSLFDYVPGTSTDDFTLRDWPPEKPPCIVPNSKIPPAEPMNPDKAKSVCGRIRDKDLRAQCLMDVTATGDAVFAMTYLTSQALKKLRKN